MVYDINRFADVTKISENTYMLCQKNADDPGYLRMYLIVGTEKALLIDTSFGMGNLKGLCEKISNNKPLTVINTHAHPDHSYGNCNFDTVYCHPYSIPILENQNAHMWDKMLDKDGNGIWADITYADIPNFKKYKILPCNDGDVFQLGDGHEIEVIFTPGHDSGHICLLDKKQRYLFVGDCISNEDIHIEGPWQGQLYPEFSTPSAYLDSMERLYSRAGEFDKLFASHGTAELSPRVIKHILDAAKSVVKSPEIFDNVEILKDSERRFKHISGLGNLIYRVKH